MTDAFGYLSEEQTDGSAETAGLSSDQLFALGEEYDYGNNGKPQDSVLAVKYYRLAADLGQAEARFALRSCSE